MAERLRRPTFCGEGVTPNGKGGKREGPSYVGFGFFHAWDVLPLEPYCSVTHRLSGWVEDCALDAALLRTRHWEPGHQQSNGGEKGSETPAIRGCKTTRRSGRSIHKATRFCYPGILLGYPVTAGTAGCERSPSPACRYKSMICIALPGKDPSAAKAVPVCHLRTG